MTNSSFPQQYVKAIVPSWCVSATVTYYIAFSSCCLLVCMWLLMCLTVPKIHSSWCCSYALSYSGFRRSCFIWMYITKHIVFSHSLLWDIGLFCFLRWNYSVFLERSYHLFPQVSTYAHCVQLINKINTLASKLGNTEIKSKWSALMIPRLSALLTRFWL